VLGSVSVARGATITAEQVARCVAQRPGKFLGFASIDPTAAGAADELDRASSLGLAGITVSPSGQNFHPMQGEAMRLFEACAKRGLPVIVQNDALLDPRAKLTLAQPHLFDEVAQALPELRLVIGGLGDPWIHEALVMLGRHAHVYADIAGLVGEPWRLYQALLEAWQRGVTGKIFFASGFPFVAPAEAIMNVYACHTMARGSVLPAVEREALRGIVERDALALLGIAPPASAGEARPAEEPLTNEPPAPPARIQGGIG
jgi:predicted TIM-barrel fold metal-dependent hydrolase